MKIFKDNHEAWDWISKNLGQVMTVDRDGNCGYCAFIKADNYSKRKHKFDLPDMEQSHEFIVNMWKDSRKWYHGSYNIFFQGNGIEDKL